MVSRGEWCHEQMERERVTKSEVYAALRRGGISSFKDVAWVVLETDA